MRLFPIAKQGLPYIVSLAVVSVLFVLLGWTFMAAVTLLATLLIINFFRDPERVTPQVPEAVVTPADGKVIFAARAQEDRFLKKETLKMAHLPTM